MGVHMWMSGEKSCGEYNDRQRGARCTHTQENRQHNGDVKKYSKSELIGESFQTADPNYVQTASHMVISMWNYLFI